MRIGDIVVNKYQVVGKLGYGLGFIVVGFIALSHIMTSIEQVSIEISLELP